MKTTPVTITVGLFAGEATGFSDEDTFYRIQGELTKLKEAGDVMGLLSIAQAASAMAQFAIQAQAKNQQSQG